MKNHGRIRVFSLLASLALLFSAGCASVQTDPAKDPSASSQTVELSVWIYPVGGWSNKARVSSLIAGFQKEYPSIHLNLTNVDYKRGDAEIKEALASENPPDLVFEGPERLVADWGAQGLMADLNDLWAEESAKSVYKNVEVACRGNSGDYYIYPLCMTTHCMAINRDLFEAADAWQYIDEETHTWTTDGFVAAVGKIAEYDKANGIERDVAAVYCEGQGGDQGTRALVNNLYGGKFTDEAHTKFTLESEENIRALRLLKNLEGIRFDPDLDGSEELKKFCDGELAMAFCWNVSLELNETRDNAKLDFDIFPMAFPTEEGARPELQGGIWGFGVFDNKDRARVEAAKTFIRYLNDAEVNARAVLISDYWPVRSDISDLYVNDKLMEEYGQFRSFLGDYYQVTPGWAQARTCWWNMLQKIGRGVEIETAVSEFMKDANSAQSPE